MEIQYSETNQTRRLLPPLLLDLAVVLMEIAGAILSARQNGASMFQFYTEDSNLLALAACALSAAFLLRSLKTGDPVPLFVRTLHYAAACCLTLTFLVVVFVLCPMYGAMAYRYMLLDGSMLFHHLLCPLALFVSFVFFEPGQPLRRKAAFWAFLPTLIYAAVSVALNLARVMDGPYPFLRVYDQPVWASCLWMILIPGGAYGIALGLRALSARFSARQKKI